ncbi:MAG: VRR-NUC domain-containing protein [Pseudomonadota bacterium]
MQLHLIEPGPGLSPLESSPRGPRAQQRAARLPELYYLQNFRGALADLGQRYAGLFSEAEAEFIRRFDGLPASSQRLLGRMLMRKGALFRRATLDYAEVGDMDVALQSLVELDWVEMDPLLSIEELWGVLRRDEWRCTFGSFARRRVVAKSDQLPLTLVEESPAPRPVSLWNRKFASSLLRLTIEPVAKNLQALYFGNDCQSWAEFVKVDLGVQHYEPVALDADSCAFRNREEIEHFYRLNDCLARLRAEEPAAAVLAHSTRPEGVSDWLQARFGRLQIRLGEALEQEGSFEQALRAYRASATSESFVRVVRLQERLGLHAAARDDALGALGFSCSEGEREALERALRRLGRRLGEKIVPPLRARVPVMEITITELAPRERVERQVCKRLSMESPAFYVENSLFPSLFGLLCWDAIFAPLPGAFFHRFQSGPADLHAREFRARRATQFDALLNLLDTGAHEAVMWRNYRAKVGISTPFVRWARLKSEILRLALVCIPPTHLKVVFERMLADLANHCSGLPDLVQFWPEERRYRLVEVKAPGDRLQDNQRRWMEFFGKHEMPAVVCGVRWGA